MSAIAMTTLMPANVSPLWRHAALALCVVLTWILFLYRDTALGMLMIWSRSDTFAHGFLVPPMVLWLVWRQRFTLVTLTPRASNSALWVVALFVFLWLMGQLVAVNAVTQLAFVALLALSVPVVLGQSVASKLAFPLGFLFMAVPIGEFLLPQLMEWTADVTVAALRLSGIPVYREGLQFVIPSGHWSVVEACSGVRYLIASFTVGTLFAYLNYRSNRRRILFVLVSLVVPVIANWMRAYMIVMLGHLSGNKIAVGVDHLLYGWVFFGVVILLMFMIGIRWAEPESIASASPVISYRGGPEMSPGGLWFAAALLACLVSLPSMALWGIDQAERVEPVRLTAPRVLAPNWRAVSARLPNLKPSFKNPSSEFSSLYGSPGQVVGVYVGYYHRQDATRKMVSSENMLVTGKDPQWMQVLGGKRLATFGGDRLTVRSTELREMNSAGGGNGSRLLAWHFYWVGGIVTANDYVAKAYGALHRLTGRGDDSAVIVIYTEKDQDIDADAVLSSFLSANYPFINELLLSARKPRGSGHE